MITKKRCTNCFYFTKLKGFKLCEFNDFRLSNDNFKCINWKPKKYKRKENYNVITLTKE